MRKFGDDLSDSCCSCSLLSQGAKSITCNSPAITRLAIEVHYLVPLLGIDCMVPLDAAMIAKSATALQDIPPTVGISQLSLDPEDV
jgi:hypothetical protein